MGVEEEETAATGSYNGQGRDHKEEDREKYCLEMGGQLCTPSQSLQSTQQLRWDTNPSSLTRTRGEGEVGSLLHSQGTH